MSRRGIYVASRASLSARGEMWRLLRASGWPIISSWIDEDGEGQTVDFCALWQRICHEVKSAEAMLFYAEACDFPLKGALVEVGMALASGIPIVACLPGVVLEPRSCRPLGSWVMHPLVRRIDHLERAIAAASEAREAEVGGAPFLGM